MNMRWLVVLFLFILSGCGDGPTLSSSAKQTTSADRSTELGKTKEVNVAQEKKLTRTRSAYSFFADAATGLITEYGHCWGGVPRMRGDIIHLSKEFKRGNRLQIASFLLGDEKEAAALYQKASALLGRDGDASVAAKRKVGHLSKIRPAIVESEQCNEFWSAINADTAEQRYFAGLVLSAFASWSRPYYGNTCEQQDEFIDARCILDLYIIGSLITRVADPIVPQITADITLEEFAKIFVNQLAKIVATKSGIEATVFDLMSIERVTIASAGMTPDKIGGNVYSASETMYIGCSENGCQLIKNTRPWLSGSHIGGQKLEVQFSYTDSDKLAIAKTLKTVVNAASNVDASADLKR